MNDCSKIYQLLNSDLIHFNERKRIYFNRVEQRKAKMHLLYKLSRSEIVRQCLQQINNSQSVAMKVNSVIIVRKLFLSKDEQNEKKFYDEKILIKVCVARYKNNFFVCKVS